MTDDNDGELARSLGEKQANSPEQRAQREAEARKARFVEDFSAALADVSAEIAEDATLLDLADGFYDGNWQRPAKEVMAQFIKANLPSFAEGLATAGNVPGVVAPMFTSRPVRTTSAAPRAAANANIAAGRGDGDQVPPEGGDLPAPGDRSAPPVVQLGRTREEFTEDLLLWRVIRDRCRAIGFNNYSDYVNRVLCGDIAGGNDEMGELQAKLRTSHVQGRDSYALLKVATEAFLLQEAGLFSNELIEAQVGGQLATYNGNLTAVEKRALELARSEYLKELSTSLPKLLPYMDLVQRGLTAIPVKQYGALGLGADAPCYGIIPSRLSNPCMLELIWSYWHEESGVVQALNAVSLRFQNRRNPNLRDPLERMAVDPLRPLNNLLWGFIESETSRLTLSRRAHEYEHEYGLTLQGKAIRGLNPVDRRGKFIRAFHTLLHLCTRFFRDDDDATIFADGFPLLNSLREVHLLLSQGAHNQYGDLPWTSRSELLIQMWLLARPEMREFLGGRVMVPYNEPWMGQLETMRDVQKWGSSPVTHFRDLANYGERILLSIRFTAWTSTYTRAAAVNWAKFWRDEIQSYIHAYRALTGADLTADMVDFTPPAELLQKAERRAE